MYYEGPAGPYIHGACPTWRDTCRVHMRACVAGEWGTAHITGHDLSLDLCADHILWHHIVCPMDGDRPTAGRQSAGSWQCNVDGLTADGLTGCMLLCNAPAVTTPTQGSDLWRGTVSLCHSLFMQDPTRATKLAIVQVKTGTGPPTRNAASRRNRTKVMPIISRGEALEHEDCGAQPTNHVQGHSPSNE